MCNQIDQIYISFKFKNQNAKCKMIEKNAKS